jgi:FkbM family methyltransferase
MSFQIPSVKELREAWRWQDAKHSYSQAGEDLIVDFIAGAMQIDPVTYLDIGAHDPIKFSNTYLFYKRGSQGVLVEPDPTLCDAIKRVRPRDVCVEAGVGKQDSAGAPFYVMTTKTLNTFSKSEAERYQAMGSNQIEKVTSVAIVTVDQILKERFAHDAPVFVSIDVEGLDYDVLTAIDFNNIRPPIVCIETLSYSETREEVKDVRIAEFMKDNDYFVFGDTYINTIFVDRERWRRGTKSS